MTNHLRTVCVLTGLLAAAGCASQGSGSNPATTATFSHPQTITNPYLPLGSLKQDILVSKDERVERTVRADVHKTFVIGSQTIEALAVEDREYGTSGDLTEATLDYFAQDDAGNVYYLGEDVDTYKNGVITGHTGGWLLGKETTIPGLLFPAHPKVGNKFKSENVPGITTEDDEVILTDTGFVAPGKKYVHCVKVKEKASDGDVEYKWYALGIGCVAEADTDGTVVLESHTTN